MKKNIFKLAIATVVLLSSGLLKAQTSICPGDSVCLHLTNFYQGNVQWQESPDGNTWTDITGATNDTSCFAVNNDSTYFRAAIADGTCDTFYSDTTFLVYTANSDTFLFTGSIVDWVVPNNTNCVRIEAIGAQGGSVSVNCTHPGGAGARMIGSFSLNPGDSLRILVGEEGHTNNADGGGGGGSFVVLGDTLPLVVAGGGGGATNNIGNCGNGPLDGIDATITTSGTASGNGNAAGGINGNGGQQTDGGSGGGGGGFYTDGAFGANANAGGKAYVNGAAGGIGFNNNNGGFGGGGCGWHTGGGGGGGGGYSGGGNSGQSPWTGGGGGGSFNSGSNQQNTAGYNTSGNGMVVIFY